MKLLIQPGDGVTSLIQSMERAKSCIEIAIFRFDHGGIEKALVNAVKRGVAVRALIAHVNGSGGDALRKLELRLLAAGVTVSRTDTDLVRYHSKYVLVDRRELFVLAFNFTHQDIDESRSFGVITRKRELVQQAGALFEADCKRQTFRPSVPNLIVSPFNSRTQLMAFIKGAKSELLIYDPRISDAAILRQLEELNGKITIRVIGRVWSKSSPLSVKPLGPMRLHTRSIIRDRKALFIGSQSLRELELDGRRELGIISRDRTAVARMAAVFEEDWAASEATKTARQPAVHVVKAARKVAKAVSKQLPPVEPVFNGAVRALGVDANVKVEEIEETVREAVQDVVQSVIEQVIEQKVEVA